MAVSPNSRDQATVAGIYSVFMPPTPPPPPEVEVRWPFALDRICRRVKGSGLSPPVLDIYFMIVHNILPLRGRLAALGTVANGACYHCEACADVAHFFQHSASTSDLWDSLKAKLVIMLPRFSSDWELLMLAFPACLAPVERLWWWHMWGSWCLSSGRLHAASGLPPEYIDLVASLKCQFSGPGVIFLAFLALFSRWWRGLHGH
jgi:hypothetical protein